MYILKINEGIHQCDGTVQSSVSSLGLNVDSYLYLVSGVPIPMDTVPEDGCTVDAIRVASGG